MKHQSKQKGFTLIELIVVIVILGILAVTAAPKFIDITGDARTAAREGVVGAIRGALTMGHGKAAVDGFGRASGAVSMNDEFVNVTNGYPSVTADASADGISGTTAFNIITLMDIDGLNVSQGRTGTAVTLTITLAADCTVTLVDSAGPGIFPVIGGITTCA